MSTTVDNLIDLKDEAVATCCNVEAKLLAILPALPHDSTRVGVQECIAALGAVREASELYDAADGDEDATSVEDYEEHQQVARLAQMLNDGKGQTEALEALDVDPDAVSTEHECLPLDDPHNAIVDLCNGTLVRRDSAGRWAVERY